MITAEAAAAVPLASDGRLPELQLHEGEKKPKREDGRGVHPLVLFGVLGTSMVLSVMLVVTDFGPPGSSGARDRARARQEIETRYYAEQHGVAPRSYQIDLRAAYQAHSRGDHKTERELYRKVLQQLRRERGPYDRALTGNREDDKRLEELISILLTEA